MPDVIYYFPVDEHLNEGEAVPIRLLPDGSADLSGLPQALRDNLETFGVNDPVTRKQVRHTDGARFLDALLNRGGPYLHVRSTPEPAAPTTV
jgi:hypothetical protein